ncbi:MAG: hypothetical protein HZA52_06770 [Planctomycetes bacterium]|nr:hypothetical protein [Planctomycetota bacterium]
MHSNPRTHRALFVLAVALGAALGRAQAPKAAEQPAVVASRALTEPAQAPGPQAQAPEPQAQAPEPQAQAPETQAQAPGQQAQAPGRQGQGGGAAPSDDAFTMGSPPVLAPGTTEEQMWPAATAEGWKKPCLVVWQRSFDDALRVARAENRPILVAVNMDGEIASEHFAGVRYREPETAALLARYVCVIASVYRHTPRDHDEQGRRVECPRFGTVTCNEHIENERLLYAKYFDGKRISPRHIVLDLEEKETLDVYFSWDTATVFTTFVKGVEGWSEPSPSPERTLVERTQSAKVQDRQLIERAYTEGDRATRRELLEALATRRVVDQVEVLRAAIFGFDLELASLARRALAQCETEPALDLMAEALQVPLEASDRELLLAAVARLAETSPRARTLAALHSGLPQTSRQIDTRVLTREYDVTSVRNVDVQAREEAAEARPNEPGALLEFAEALLARSQQSAPGRYATLLLEDARSAARDAEKLGAKGARLDALIAVIDSEFGDFKTARERAVAAVESGVLRTGDDATPAPSSEAATLTGASKARVLWLFADARQRAIRDAFRNGGTWPPEWLADVNSAYSVLAKDGLVGEPQLVDYHDFLRWLGATARANTVLDDALARFPNSALLHERLRARLLWEAGPKGLEQGYADRLAREAAPTTSQLTWFAGYASLVAAEHLRRRSDFDGAVAAYRRAAVFYERNAELHPEGRDTCLHFRALGGAGEARVALEHGDLAVATERLLASLALRQASAASVDGLNITPIQTAKMLHARLLDSGDTARAERVKAALDALDPKLLEPPPSEQGGSGRRPPRGR